MFPRCNESPAGIDRSLMMSACSSSDISLWPSVDTDTKSLEAHEGSWTSSNVPTHPEKVTSSDKSSLNFSGPYILCQVSQPQPSLFLSGRMNRKIKRSASNLKVLSETFGEETGTHYNLFKTLHIVPL